MHCLPPDWTDHLSAGVSLRLGSCKRGGLPAIGRGLAAEQLADGRIRVLLEGRACADVLQGVRETSRISAVMSLPSTHRTLHVKGHDGVVSSAGAPADHQLLRLRLDAFARQVVPFGFAREDLVTNWYDVRQGDLWAVTFSIAGAWNQTPGPGAGQPLDLLPARVPAQPTETSTFRDQTLDDAADDSPVESPALPDSALPALTLTGIRRMLEGVVPPAMCSVSADGVPHVAYLSHAEYVDADHVALTFQFLNRSRINVLATGRVALSVDDPYTGASVTMQLQYLRTETTGPLFERLRAKLAGIAAHTGMEKVFRLLGADLYRVFDLRRVDKLLTLPCLEPRCDLAAGARRLSQRLAESPDLAALLQTTMDGLQRDLGIANAILWLLDEKRQGLFTIASCGYPHSGVGAEMALADAGLTGVAVREEVPIRIGHMSQAYRYGMSWRQRAQELGMDAVIEREIPLPGLALPRSQLAVPLRARGRTVGALLLESDRDQFFSYDDEDVLLLLCAQLAQALSALQTAEIDAGVPPRPQQAAVEPQIAAASTAPSLHLRHYPRDDSVFADDHYLIKGVAGAILWKLVQDVQQRGRSEFTTRELRLAGGDLRLPDVQDNLGVRLLLLERRLAERSCGLAIERTGRGRFRLMVQRPLVLIDAVG